MKNKAGHIMITLTINAYVLTPTILTIIHGLKPHFTDDVLLQNMNYMEYSN